MPERGGRGYGSLPLTGARTGGFTCADYLTWPEDERWELIEGVAWSMSSVPFKLFARSHQRILLNLARLIADITDSGPCETYLAPFDVRLRENRADSLNRPPDPAGELPDESITTVVQLDISVFCSPDILMMEELSRSASPKRQFSARFGDNALTTAVCGIVYPVAIAI